jgi:hypothetical protein
MDTKNIKHMTRISTAILLSSLLVSCSTRTADVAEALPEGPRNDRYYWMEDSVSWVEIKDGKFGIYWEGAATIEPVYEIDDLLGSIRLDGYCYFYDGAHFAIGRDGKWGVMDNRGVVTIPFEYEHVKIQRGEDDKMMCAGVRKNGKYAVAGPTGEVVTGFDYEEFYGDFNWRSPENPLIAMHKGDRVVFYDLTNKKEVGRAPDSEFTQGIVTVRFNGKSGVIVPDGSFVVPAEYDWVIAAGGTGPWYFTVCNDGRCGIWLTGKGLVLPMEYESATIERVDDKLFYIASRDSLSALLDDKGNNLTDFDYEYFYVDDSIGLVASRREKLYAIDGKGNETEIRQ